MLLASVFLMFDLTRPRIRKGDILTVSLNLYFSGLKYFQQLTKMPWVFLAYTNIYMTCLVRLYILLLLFGVRMMVNCLLSTGVSRQFHTVLKADQSLGWRKEGRTFLSVKSVSYQYDHFFIKLFLLIFKIGMKIRVNV